MAEGYFFSDQDPEQQQLAQRQAYAQALLQRGMNQQNNGQPNSGIKDFGSAILGAYLSKKFGDQAKQHEQTRESNYSTALGNLLAPNNAAMDVGGGVASTGGGLVPGAGGGVSNDPGQGYVAPQASGSGLDAQGQPAPVNVTPQVGANLGQRLQASGNPDLMRQLAPQLLAQQLQAQAPMTAYQRAELADRADQRAYERTGADYSTLDQGSTDIQKAMDSSITIPKYQMGIQKGADTAAAEANAKLPAEMALAKAKEQAAAAQASEHGWTVMQDPTNGKQFNYNPNTHKATDLAGNPYTPGGAGKLQSGMPRSPATAAFMKWQSENPNASAADYQQMAGKISQTVAGGRALGGGQDGAGILAANAASQHLKVYEDLAQAMNNGDVQAINSAKNRWQQEFGTAAPTNAEFANQIVGPELVKAIVAGGGTGAERQEMEKALSTNKSWEQASGLAATAKRLMGGQLAARQKKFTFNGLGSTDDFRKGLEPEAQSILDQFGGSGASALPNSPTLPTGAKPAAQFRYDANGNRVSQ